YPDGREDTHHWLVLECFWVWVAMNLRMLMALAGFTAFAGPFCSQVWPRTPPRVFGSKPSAIKRCRCFFQVFWQRALPWPSARAHELGLDLLLSALSAVYVPQ